MFSRLLFFFFITTHAAIQEQDGVWILTDSNLKEALQKQGELFIHFYQPDCSYCLKLFKPYSQAAKRLKDLIPPIHISKVDISQNPLLAQQYDPKSFPSFKYVTKDSAEEFLGSRSEDGFFSWVTKKSGQPFSVITDLNTLKSKLAKTKVAVVYFGELDTSEYRVFSVVAKKVDDPSFFVCSDVKAWKEFAVEGPSVVMFKQFDEKRVDFEGSILTGELVEFVERHKNPWIVEFNEVVDDYIYAKRKVCLLLLRHFTEGKEYDKILKKLSRQLQGKFVMAYLDISPEEHRTLAQTFGITGKKQPMALILNPAKNLKYLLEGPITEETLKTFLKDWKSGKIKPHIRSQELPENDYENSVRILVAKNYESVISDKNLNVLVMFYSVNCDECKKFMIKYEKLAKKLKGKIEVCKLDAGANEIRGMKFEQLPVFWLFAEGNKKGVEYKEGLDIEELERFLIKNVEVAKSDL